MQIENNSVVSFHYKLCKVDTEGNKGEWMESSFDGEPVFCLIGHRNIVSGLEKAMMGKSEGEEFSVTVTPEEGYGVRKEGSVQRVPIKHLHLANKKQKLLPGTVVTVQTDQGARNMVVVKAGKFNVDVDMNHPLAGATLFYELKIDNVREASAEEVAHRHVHGPGGHQH
ncbi:MAG: FKBP-type peptidyl-prolyl cis-trans isomerase [Cellvibrionaceae bacterium]